MINYPAIIKKGNRFRLPPEMITDTKFNLHLVYLEVGIIFANT